MRGASARKLRLALTVSAIVVGVAFLSGTLVLTATVRAAMRQQVGTTAPGLAVEITPVEGFGNRVSLAASLGARVSVVKGVSISVGQVLGPVELVGSGQSKISAVAVSVASSPGLRGFALKSGHFPSGAGEVVVDDSTFKARHWSTGEQISVAGTGPSEKFTIVGVVGADTAQGLQVTPVAAFTLPAAQQLLGLTGRYTDIAVSAARGVTPSVLAARIAHVLGPQYQVQTAGQIENQAVAADFKAFSLLSSVLVVLGAIVLFVAAFLVVNTFSIVVAQRTRELALLRCLGASRGQLMSSVLAEALVVGAAAAAVGVALGIVGAVILLSVLPGVGLDLPSVTPAIHTVAVLVPLALGAGATLAASVLPALRATSIPPIAALRDDPVAEAVRHGGARGGIGAAVLACGVGLLLAGLFTGISPEGDIVGAGAVLAFVGLASLSPLVARPLARALGWPLVKTLGLPAYLARQSAMRNPRRTASTSAALLVGVALVSFMAVITASARASATNNITSALRAAYVVEGNTSGSMPLGGDIVSSLRSQKALSQIIPVSYVRFKIAGAQHSGFVVNPATYPSVVNLGNVQGHISSLGPGNIAVSSSTASSEGWHLGQRVYVDLGNDTQDPLVISAVFSTGDSFGGVLFSSVHPPAGLGAPVTSRVFVEGIRGLNPTIVRSAISSALARFPQATVQDGSSLETNAINQVNQIVNLITVILILAVLIGLVGIVNTLALSVLERTREIGLLRALGMSRGQIKAMIRHESVIVALLGAVAGVIVGLFLAWAMQHSLVDQGLTILRIPVSTLIAYLVAAGACGVVAGILPARRAAELDVLAAIYSE